LFTGKAPGNFSLVVRGEELPPDDSEELYIWGRDRESLHEAIRAQSSELHRCYEAWLLAEPALAGKLTVAFSVGRAQEGDTVDSVVAIDVADSDLDHALFEGCVLGALGELLFEGGEETIKVRLPVVFRQEGD